MSCNQYGRKFKNFLQRQRTVNQHISRRRTHENLYSANPVRFNFLNLFYVIICSAHVERVIGKCTPLSNLIFLLQLLNCNCRRIVVGHIHKTCNSPKNSRFALALYSSPLAVSWLSKVHLVINNSGQNMESRSEERRVGKECRS